MLPFAPDFWAKTPARTLFIAGGAFALMATLGLVYPLGVPFQSPVAAPIVLTTTLVLELGVLRLATKHVDKGAAAFAAILSVGAGAANGLLSGVLVGLIGLGSISTAFVMALFGAGFGLFYGLLFAPVNAILVALARMAQRRGTQAALDAAASGTAFVLIVVAAIVLTFVHPGSDSWRGATAGAAWPIAAFSALSLVRASWRSLQRKKWLARIERGDEAGLRIVAASELQIDHDLPNLDATHPGNAPRVLVRVHTSNDDSPYRRHEEIVPLARVGH
jgi:MFS family permease